MEENDGMELSDGELNKCLDEYNKSLCLENTPSNELSDSMLYDYMYDYETRDTKKRKNNDKGLIKNFLIKFFICILKFK